MKFEVETMLALKHMKELDTMLYNDLFKKGNRIVDLISSKSYDCVPEVGAN